MESVLLNCATFRFPSPAPSPSYNNRIHTATVWFISLSPFTGAAQQCCYCIVKTNQSHCLLASYLNEQLDIASWIGYYDMVLQAISAKKWGKTPLFDAAVGGYRNRRDRCSSIMVPMSTTWMTKVKLWCLHPLMTTQRWMSYSLTMVPSSGLTFLSWPPLKGSIRGDNMYVLGERTIRLHSAYMQSSDI